ncbi:MAG: S8 family serine peptidase [Pyrinomonadaceae bacterium]
MTRIRIRPAVATINTGFYDPQRRLTSVDEAVRQSIRAGVTYTIAAGNDNRDAGDYTPQRVAEAITVGASDLSNKLVGATGTTEFRASYCCGLASNYGSVLDLFAPGQDGYGAETGFYSGSNSNYGGFGGTSMSAPMVAGVAAMYLEANPFAPPLTVSQAIRDNSTIGVLSEVGPGSPNRLLYTNFFVAARDTFQFSAANYTANEGDGSLTVTVTRTGGNNLPATVEYATSDNTVGVRCDSNSGMASDRCDYTTTLGVLRFAAGETSKTITIYLTDDAFVEGTETGRIGLSMPTNGDLGTQSTATLTVTDNDSAPTSVNPIDGNRFFVRMQYIDFLNREPEQAGWDAWTGVLDRCPNVQNDPSCDRITVSSSFFRSDEFQLKGYFVYRFYTASLGRRPSYLELTRDSQRVTGATAEEVNARRTAFTDEWVLRPEFGSRYDGLSNAAYVDTLLQTSGVGNSITTAGVAYTRDQLVSQLDDGTRTRAATLRLIVESDQEYAREYNGAFVALEYFGYLRRDADEGGYQGWLNYLNSNPQDYRTMVGGFLNSVEYRLRFGQP